MDAKYRTLVGLLVALVFAAAAAPGWVLAVTPAREVVALESVLAIEDAQSPFGRYRVVFKTEAPLPPPRDATMGARFHLGNQALTLPGYDPGRTVLFGYVNELPTGSVALRVTGVAASAGAAGADIVVDPEALLAHSRPAAGEFEAAHVQRSEGAVDLWRAWNDADVVFTGMYVRRDVEPLDRGSWALQFTVDEVWRDRGNRALPRSVTVPARRLLAHYEIGARYLVFARVDQSTGAIAADPVAVRVWWPTDDFVLNFVRARAAFGDLAQADATTKQRARTFLIEALTSPAAEVRRTAAVDLLRTPDFGFTSGELAALGSQIAREPSAVVRAALQDLVARGPTT